MRVIDELQILDESVRPVSAAGLTDVSAKSSNLAAKVDKVVKAEVGIEEYHCDLFKRS